MKEDLYHKRSSLHEYNKLKFKAHDSKHYALSVFDVKTQNIEEINLQIDKHIPKYGVKCLLSDGSLFYIDGSISYIIDPLYNVKIVKPAGDSLWPCSFYHDESVYLIGGVYHNSWRYNIAEDRWISLTSFFGSWSFGQVGPLFKNYVFLWGKTANDVYIYDIDIDSYSNVSIPLISALRLVIVGNDNVFIISDKKYLYESDGNLSYWKNLGQLVDDGCNSFMISSPIYYQGCVYYANYNGIFKFDFKKKSLKTVKNIDY